MRSDAELLEAWRSRGERDALAELFRRHVDGAYRTAARILRRGPDAEDAVQTAFLAVLRQAGTIREGASFAGWLYRVVVNAALKLRAARPSPTPPPDAAAPPEEPVRDDLHQALAALPDEYRLPLELHYFEGRSYEEIAEALDCPRGTVGTRLSRGLDRLRAAMAGATAAAMIALLSAAGREARAAESAPASLVDAVAAAARSAGAGVSATAVAGLIAALALLGGAVVTYARRQPPSNPPAALAGPSAPAAPGGSSPAGAVSAPLEEGRWVTGRVLGPGGQPLEGARVWAVPKNPLDIPDPSILPHEVRPQTAPAPLDPAIQEMLETLWTPVFTDAEGRYRLALKEDVARIRASHPSAASASTEVGGPETEVRLGHGATLFGRVVDTDGRPAEGVSIHLAMEVGGLVGAAMKTSMRDLPPVARTDAGGRFQIEKVPAGRLLVGAAGAGFGLGSTSVALAEGATSEELVFRLKKGRAATGLVRDAEGKPLAKAMVALHLGTGIVARESFLGTTDAAGRYRFDGIPRGKGRILVLNFQRGSTEAALGEDETEVDIQLKAEGAFAGRVIDARTGRPIERFTVAMAEERGATPFPQEGRDGAFTLKPTFGLESDGDYFVAVRAKGYATQWSGPHAFKSGATTDVGVLSLAPGVTLSGTCVDEQGRPVAGARVAALPPGAPFEGTPTPDPESLRWKVAFHADVATSGADGAFAIDDLPAGAYDLHAWHVEYPPSRRASAATPARVVFVAGGRLAGRIPGRRKVEIRAREGWADTIQPEADGRWSYGPIAAGVYRARLLESAGLLSDRTVAERELVVTAGQTTEWNGDGAPPAVVTASGRVWTPEGRPAAGHHVVLSPDDDELVLRTSVTDAEGRFRVTDVAPGRQILHVSASLEEEVDIYRRVDLDGSTPLEVRLPRRESKIRGLATGTLRLRMAGETRMTLVVATRKADGSFEIGGLPAGRYALYAAGPEVSKDRLLRTFELGEKAEADLGRVD